MVFGAQESETGDRGGFWSFIVFCVVGRRARHYRGVLPRLGYGSVTEVPTVGASGGIYGLLIAFGMLYGDREMFLFPFPFTIKAKYLVAILDFRGG